MPSVESSIDDLYQGPLSEFVPSRARLAKTLKGPEAQRVKTLKKPTVVPWTINQLYWHARPVYDRLTRAGAALRAAQVAALGGAAANVRSASEAHRTAIAEAVSEAARLTARLETHPSGEEIARAFEAVSLRADLPEPPGRMTKTLTPPGFEALAGVAIKPIAHAAPTPAAVAAPRAPLVPRPPAARVIEDVRRRQREQAAAARRQRVEIEKAEAALRRATAAEARTRKAWEQAQEERQRAEKRLAALRAR
jgi:hypothetical protein